MKSCGKGSYKMDGKLSKEDEPGAGKMKGGKAVPKKKPAKKK